MLAAARFKRGRGRFRQRIAKYAKPFAEAIPTIAAGFGYASIARASREGVDPTLVSPAAI
jgi:hypothetical protein